MAARPTNGSFSASFTGIHGEIAGLLELFEAGGAVFFRTGPAGQLEYLSPAFARILSGGTDANFRGKNILDLFPEQEETAAGIISEIRQGLQRGKVACHLEGLRSSHPVGIEFTIRPFLNAWGEWAGLEGFGVYLASGTSEGDKKSGLETRLEEAEKIRDRFLSNISHEIRTPLNGILGMVQLLQNTRLDYDQKEFLNIIAKSGENLLQTLNQLIDLSLDLSGKLKIQEDDIEPHKLFSFISSLYSEQALLKQIDLDFQIIGELPPFVSDEFRIQQILKQLISNAILFTSKGGVLVRGKLDRHQNKSWFILEVSDSGEGIDIEKQAFIESILKKDGNAEPSFTQSGGGLGLLTVRMICEALRAEPGFVSAPGKGSTFWVKIPVKVKTIGKKEIAGEEEGQILRKLSPRVLLTDDNAVNLKVASEILSRAGCRVVLATNGKEALEKASREFFHLILMDIQMPVMDGLEASRKIQELNLENPPAIIAMTAYVMNEDKKRFLEAGMDDFIPKPISGEKILSKVRHWTEKSLLKNPLSETIYRRQEMAENKLKSIFDFEALKSLKKHLGEDILLASLEEFAGELRGMLSSMDSAVSAGNGDELLRCFHTLKGNAGTFGLPHMAEIACELENQIKIGNLAAAIEGKTRLEQSSHEFLNSYILLYTDYEWKN